MRRRPLTVALALLGACTLAPAAAPPAAGPGPLPPPGYGTLSQRALSVALRSGSLELLVTPLHESVLVAAAPDTYRRLAALAAPWRERHGTGAPLFLVSFHSDLPAVEFAPEEVHLLSGGLRARPATIEPITPGWGTRRLAQRVTESAVYLFDRPVELESELVVAYGPVESRDWTVVLPRIQAERGRARARAGGGS